MNAIIEDFMAQNGAAIDHANSQQQKITVAIKRRELAGVMLAAANQDVRYYLCGVLFDFLPDGKIKLVTTDGHRVTAMQLEQQHDIAAIQVIVPSDAIGKLKLPRRQSRAKVNNNIILLTFTITPEYTQLAYDGTEVKHPRRATIDIADNGIAITAQPIDGRFPDYDRVLPMDFEVATATINPEYLHDAQTAAQLINDTNHGGALYQNGQSVAAYWVNSNCIIGIMPMRTDSTNAERFSFNWS